VRFAIGQLTGRQHVPPRFWSGRRDVEGRAHLPIGAYEIETSEKAVS